MLSVLHPAHPFPSITKSIAGRPSPFNPIIRFATHYNPEYHILRSFNMAQQQEQPTSFSCSANGHNSNAVSQTFSNSRTRRNRAARQSADTLLQEAFHEHSHLSVNRSWAQLLHFSAQSPGEVEANANNDQGTPNVVAVAPTAAVVMEKPTAAIGAIQRLQQQQMANITTEDGLTFVRAMTIPHCQHTDWEALREFRVQEMDEIRQRAAHMENTMRWWLLSAEQWREKWLTVKAERNRLREENARLRNALARAEARKWQRAEEEEKKGKGENEVDEQKLKAAPILVMDSLELVSDEEEADDNSEQQTGSGQESPAGGSE